MVAGGDQEMGLSSMSLVASFVELKVRISWWSDCGLGLRRRASFFGSLNLS